MGFGEVTIRADVHLLLTSTNPKSTCVIHTTLIGITTFSYLEELVGKGVHNKTPELEALVNSGMFYFNRVIELYGDLPGLEVCLSHNQAKRLPFFVSYSRRWHCENYQVPPIPS